MDQNTSTTYGAIGELTPEHVLRAVASVKTGKIYSLAVETNPEAPAYPGRTYQVLTDRIFVDGSGTYGDNKLQGFDDFVSMWCGVGTHLDGFAHVAVDGRHYHGLPSEQVIQPRGAKKYGIETVPPVVARGILLDIPRLRGVPALEAGFVITKGDLEAAADAQGIEIRRGDIALVHTGWLRSVANKDPFADSEPGIGLGAAKFLVEEKGVVAIGSDNWALEAIPAEDPMQFLPVHGYLLVERGVHIIENVWTRDLAVDQAYEFMFVMAAPKLVGALQSPIHPLAVI